MLLPWRRNMDLSFGPEYENFRRDLRAFLEANRA